MLIASPGQASIRRVAAARSSSVNRSIQRCCVISRSVVSSGRPCSTSHGVTGRDVPRGKEVSSCFDCSHLVDQADPAARGEPCRDRVFHKLATAELELARKARRIIRVHNLQLAAHSKPPNGHRRSSSECPSTRAAVVDLHRSRKTLRRVDTFDLLTAKSLPQRQRAVRASRPIDSADTNVARHAASVADQRHSTHPAGDRFHPMRSRRTGKETRLLRANSERARAAG